ncbi:NAD(P)-binding protein [Microstroma glucosiphilum]|uniref:NAD(P)-binding protein n=1 Tax=Pseudomicrostroma glucosiphilum TaxID=1684307 RepID=A0A316UJK5_9BASI|nr:NAD(P)-binding protein [Pseudomicrostroma glucosiphilum]PWN24143.1 NAD(P)-binding protein [Pseudomicrostroma glucosiphilum]
MAQSINLPSIRPTAFLSTASSLKSATRYNGTLRGLASFKDSRRPTDPALSAVPSRRSLQSSPNYHEEAQRLSQHLAQSKVGVTELNSLLSALARPPIKSSRSEDPVVRFQRKARFNALLDTFHSATVCSAEETEATLEEHFNQFAQDALHLPSSPHVVLQGIASSMTEPSLNTTGNAGASSSAEAISETNPGKLVSAAAIAKPFVDSITSQIESRVTSGKRRPRLVGILATPSPPSIAYAEWTKKACESVGMEFDIWRTWDQAEGAEPPSEDDKKPGLEDDVEDLIIAANADETVDGIMVYFPVFGGRQDTYLSQIIKPSKDVEGLSFSFAWNLYHNVRWIAPSQLGGAPGATAEGNVLTQHEKEQVTASLQGKNHDHSLGNDEAVPPGLVKGILPCTPLAIVKCLEAMGVYDRSLPYGDRLRGKTITVINRSEVVGRPLAALLANDGARVFSVDLDSIQEFSKRGRSGSSEQAGEQEAPHVPSKAVRSARERNASSRVRPHHIVRPSPLQDQASCVAASSIIISGVPSANFKVPTDSINPGSVVVNFSSEKNFEKDVRRRAAVYLPAVGKMTCTMLQRNLLRLVEAKDMIEDGSGR